METNVSYTLVGTFVLTLIAGIILALIWLSSGLTLEHYVKYEVLMTESVSGITVDSPVEFNGVNVGSVETVTLDPKNPRAVDILISIKGSTPISKGTLATMSVKGFTGFGYMALQDVGDDLAPLVAEPGQPYPVIKSGPSVYLRIDAAVAKINKSVQQVSDAVAALLDKENLDSIKQTLLHIRDLTATLAGNGQQINTILHNTANASEHFAPAMQTFQAETIPSLNETIANFATVGQDLSAVATELKQNPAVLIRGKTPRAPGPGE